MNVNGSGRKELVGKDAKEGIGGMLQPPPPPLAACVTVTVCDGTPVAETVMVAVRAEVLVFPCAVTVTVPLFEPDVGLTVSHAWLSVTVQLVLDVMLNVPVLFAAAARFRVPGDTERVAPVEQRLLAVDPVPAGGVVDVVMFSLSSCAPSSR